MIELVKKYVENRIQLVKLELISVLANISAGLVNSFLILIIALFILQMFSVALAFWLSEIFESHAIGFVIVGGIYTIAIIFYMVFAKQRIDTKVKDKVVRTALAAGDELSEMDDNTEL